VDPSVQAHEFFHLPRGKKLFPVPPNGTLVALPEQEQDDQASENRDGDCRTALESVLPRFWCRSRRSCEESSLLDRSRNLPQRPKSNRGALADARLPLASAGVPYAGRVNGCLGQAANGSKGRTRFLKRSKPARPYICRLIVLSRLICPSMGPLFQGTVIASLTALRSRPRVFA
jgi:hypothetical protein